MLPQMNVQNNDIQENFRRKESPCRESDPLREERGKGSDHAEHVVVCAHRVVVHEQVASEGFVVEVV